MSIEDWRNRIDELNGELISLLNKRASYATEIGKLKKEMGLPVFDASREEKVLDKVADLSSQTSGPLAPDSFRRIFQVIMEETRKVEE